MNNTVAQTRPGQRDLGDVSSDRDIVSHGSTYDQRIYDLECYIERLEYALMMTEMQRDSYRRTLETMPLII